MTNIQITEIKSKNNSITRIIHLADIHIRLFKRKDEYKHVFKNLYKKLKNVVQDGDIMVIAGDLVHAKTEMSPEMVDLLNDFISNLSKICEVIITPGNHDANLNNIKRMDALSPVIKAMNLSNVHYLRNSGVYTMGNVAFAVMSVFSDIKDYPKAKDIDDTYTKIAIYHGPVNGSHTDTGYEIHNDKMTVNFFNGFDIVLLGDIHKKQRLQEYGEINIDNTKIKKPVIEYCGSLVQQNHGESLKNHGFLLWDIKNKKSEFYEVENDYGYVTINIDNGSIVDEPEYVPKKPTIRLRVFNSDTKQIRKIVSEIRKKYKPIELSTNRMTTTSDMDGNNSKIDLTSIRDVSFQNTLIDNYLNINYNIDKETLESIFDINKELNASLPVVDIIRNVSWKPKVFKFANMFSYGDDNIIDFTKTNGIVGLFSHNASGKTSAIESFIFCLFDKCSKTFKASRILNNRKNYFWCELNFELNGVDYFIKRIAEKQKNGNVPVKVDFYKIDSDGNRHSLNGEKRSDTDSIIRSYIGSYDDFILTAVSSQNNTANFVDKSQTERKDLLAQFMDITIFDQLYELGSSKIKEYETLIKQYDNRNFDAERENIVSNLSKLRNVYKKLEIEKNNISNIINNLNSESISLAKQLISIDDSIVDIEFLIKQKEDLEIKIDNNSNKLNEKEIELNKKLDKYAELKSEFDLIDEEMLNNKLSVLKQVELEYDVVESDINDLKNIVKSKLDKANKLLELKYDPDCKYCMNNIFVKDAIKAKEELDKDKQKSDALISKRKSIKNKLDSLLYVRDDEDKFNKLSKSMSDLKVEILSLKGECSDMESILSNSRSSLDKINENIEKHYKQEENIEKNNKIEKELTKIESKMSELKTDLDDVESKLREEHSKILSDEKEIEKIDEMRNKVKSMEDKQVSYQYYLEAVKRDAIPYELISDAIPIIEQEINNILNQVVDFNVLLELDGKNINAKIVYDENKIWPLDMASGMEKFISGLAIRSALINISNLPRPNFIAIDEGFSTLDADNSSNLPLVFDYLKSQFDFILIISHMDYIRDFVDISLDLKKDNNFSKIIFK